MKHTTVKYRIPALLLSLCLLFAALPVSVAAASDSESAYATFVTNDAAQTVTGTFPAVDSFEMTSKVYHPYDKPYSPRVMVSPRRLYAYKNKVTANNFTYHVYSPERGGDFLMLSEATPEGARTDYLYTDEGVALVEALIHGKAKDTHHSLTYNDGYDYCYDIDQTTDFQPDDYYAMTVTPTVETMELSLSELKFAPHYTLWENESHYHAFGVNVGVFFDLNGDYYFLDTRSLADSDFAGAGELNYQSDTKVTVHLLTMKRDKVFRSALRYASRVDVTYQNEANHVKGDNMFGNYWTPNNDLSPLYSAIVFLGLLVPIAPLTVGLCLPHSKKPGNHKRWYILAIAGAVWMACGGVILGIVIAVL